MDGPRRSKRSLASGDDSAEMSAPSLPPSKKARKGVAIVKKSEPSSTAKTSTGQPAAKRRPGRPSKTSKPAVQKSSAQAPFNSKDNLNSSSTSDLSRTDVSNLIHDPHHALSSGPAYWVAKTGVDVQPVTEKELENLYEELEAGRPAPYHGARNYAVRANLRAMRVGDLVLLIKVTGKRSIIYGITRVELEYYLDDTQFDKTHPGYDVAATHAESKWGQVQLVLEEKFPEAIRMSDVKMCAKAGGVLEALQLLTMPNVGVTKASSSEFNFIKSLVDRSEEKSGTIGGAKLTESSKTKGKTETEKKSKPVDKTESSQASDTAATKAPEMTDKGTTLDKGHRRTRAGTKSAAEAKDTEEKSGPVDTSVPTPLTPQIAAKAVEVMNKAPVATTVAPT